MSYAQPPYAPGPDQQQQPVMQGQAPAAVTYYPQAGPPQQQPQQMVIQQPGTVVVGQPVQRPQSFVMHIVLSCFVFFCCGGCCGAVAFIFARKSTVGHMYRPKLRNKNSFLTR